MRRSDRSETAGPFPPRRRVHRRLPALLLAVACLAAAGCAPESADPAAKASGGAESTPRHVPEYAIEQFLETTSVFGGSFSPDGERILVSSDATGIFNAYAVPVSGGEPEPLTRSEDDAVRVASYFPTDERFLYLQDDGGDELHHVYVRETDGSVRDLTPGGSLKADFLGWADDDRSFYLATNERDSRYFDIYEVSVDGYERALLYRDTTGFEFGDISPDERYIALSKSRTTSDSDIWLHDRSTGGTRNLTSHEGQVANSPQEFSPDGESLYYTTDEGSEFAYLARMDLETGATETVLQPDWDVWYATFSDAGRYLVVGINEDARTRLRVFEMPGMRAVELPVLADKDITSVSFSSDEERMAFYASTARTPRNLYVHRMGERAAPRQLTDNLSAAIDPEDLVAPEVVRFASYDGVEVPGLLYGPHEASPDARVPALVWVHGGPGGQSRIGYSNLIQYLVNHGYGVYAINNRGSTGYGKTFFRMDDRRHGDADLGDVVASKGMLAETGWVDPDRIGIIGGSYGGYMVLAALAFRPEAFEAGVDLFGISNWVRTLENVPPWWESFREALYTEMGDPEEDRERLLAKSPLFHADSIRRPLMVLQGANDPRVLQVESDEIVEAVRQNGVPVEYVVFEDEGHGFAKKENQAEGWRKVLAFLDTHLKSEALETAPAGAGAAPAGAGAEPSGGR